MSTSTNKKFSFQGGVFTIITKEKEQQNDKERILKKFNFIRDKNEAASVIISDNKKAQKFQNVNSGQRNKSANSSNRLEKINSLKSDSTIKTKKNQDIFPLKSQKTRNKMQKHRQSKSFTNANPSNQNKQSTLSNTNGNNYHRNDSFCSEQTKKENESHMILVNNSIRAEEFKINKEEKMSSLSLLDQENSRLGENGDFDFCKNENDETPKSRNSILSKNKKALNHYVFSEGEGSPIMNNNNNLSQGGGNSGFDNYDENYFCPRYEKINLREKKLQRLFAFSPEYDMSYRLINDELNNNKSFSTNSEYKFINQIREENQQIQRINYKSFIRLSDYSLYYLISFIFENYNTLVYKTNKYIYSKINLSMNNIFKRVIEDFSKKYKNILRIEKFSFFQKNFVFHKKSFPLLNLVLKAKIVSNEINKCYEIGYTYMINQKEYNNIWKFDLRKKNSSITTWFSSECEIFNDNLNRFCYSQPISSFSVGDVIEIHINIFSKNGAINPFSIQWSEVKIEEAPKGFYQKSMVKSPYLFDKLRACEVENMIHFWRTDKNFLENSILIKEFKKIFMRHFIIETIFYDVSKIYLYKIFLRANSVGKITKNKFANFEFEVVQKDQEIQNEIQSIFLLNSNFFADKIQIRQGSNVIFYVIDL